MKSIQVGRVLSRVLTKISKATELDYYSTQLEQDRVAQSQQVDYNPRDSRLLCFETWIRKCTKLPLFPFQSPHERPRVKTGGSV